MIDAAVVRISQAARTLSSMHSSDPSVSKALCLLNEAKRELAEETARIRLKEARNVVEKLTPLAHAVEQALDTLRGFVSELERDISEATPFAPGGE